MDPMTPMTPAERAIYDAADAHERFYLDLPAPTFWSVVFEDAGSGAVLGAVLSALAFALSAARPVEMVLFAVATVAFSATFVAFWTHARRRWRTNRDRCFKLVETYIARRRGEATDDDT